jgi:hypothetical protein
MQQLESLARARTRVFSGEAPRFRFMIEFSSQQGCRADMAAVDGARANRYGCARNSICPEIRGEYQ